MTALALRLTRRRRPPGPGFWLAFASLVWDAFWTLLAAIFLALDVRDEAWGWVAWCAFWGTVTARRMVRITWPWFHRELKAWWDQ